MYSICKDSIRRVIKSFVQGQHSSVQLVQKIETEKASLEWTQGQFSPINVELEIRFSRERNVHLDSNVHLFRN